MTLDRISMGGSTLRLSRTPMGLAILVAAVALSACGRDRFSPYVEDVDASLPIEGTYVDDFAVVHRILRERWSIDESVFVVLEVSKDASFLVAANAPENLFFPGRFSRFDWTSAAGALWYCQSAYDAETPDEAWAGPAPDPRIPSSGGCGGFPWSRLVPAPEIIGRYRDDFGSLHTITSTVWTTEEGGRYSIRQFSNQEDYLVAENARTNPWNPGLFSRFDWSRPDGQVWYCQTAYASPTEEEALRTPPADDHDPARMGCGTFPWSRLTPAVEP